MLPEQPDCNGMMLNDMSIFFPDLEQTASGMCLKLGWGGGGVYEKAERDFSKMSDGLIHLQVRST